MLTSLFGELVPPDGSRRDAAGTLPDFAATAVLASAAADGEASGRRVDRQAHELEVSGSPAHAIRSHFAATRADLDSADALITLLDPAGVWGAAVLRALSDAGGQPIERLHLREHASLRPLATIERTRLVRRQGDTLRIYHAEVQAPGSESAEISVALMERSQMSAVIVGPLEPPAIDALLKALHAATMLPSWRCPNLLFLLPPNAVWIANKIASMVWPARLNVETISESMTGASSVWNAMLRVWNEVKAGPMWESPVLRSQFGELSLAGGAGTAEDTPATRPHLGWPEPARIRIAMAGMLALDGLLGCALVDIASGQVLGREAPDATTDMTQAGGQAAHLLRAHRQAADGSGLVDPVDEVLTSAGALQQLIRPLLRFPALGLVALFDKHRTNLSLARLQMSEVERGLGV